MKMKTFRAIRAGYVAAKTAWKEFCIFLRPVGRFISLPTNAASYVTPAAKMFYLGPIGFEIEMRRYNEYVRDETE